MKNSVIELRATGSSPAATQVFLDAVMDEYLALKKNSRKRISSGALTSITDQINEVEKQMQKQQAQVSLFQTSNNIPYLTEHGLSAGSHLAKLDETLSELRTEHSILELITPAEFRGLSEGSPGALSGPALPGEKAARALAMNTAAPQSAYYEALQQVELLKATRAEFARVLRPAHSKMVKLNQEIAGLEQLLKTLQDDGEQRALAQMEDRKKSLDLQIQNLESQYRTWETNAAEASGKLTDYDRMNQDLQRSQALYDRLLGLLQSVDLNNDLDQEQLVPLAPASLARPTLSKYGIAAAGLFLALLVGVGAFLFLDFLDDRFSSVTELSLHLPAEVLGQIPEARLSAPKRIRRLLPAAEKQPAFVESEMQPAFAESFRNLRSSLSLMSGPDTQPKVVLVTSAIPNEGKSTVAANLAATLARSGSRVLLVDGDFRRGSVHRIFHVGHKPGLLEVLREGVSPAQAIVPTANPNLFILPAGEAGSSTSDIFLRCRVDLLLQKLAAQYTYIVIDSAPVLVMDDAACLGSHTDGVLLVVRASYTSARMVREALDRLSRRKVKVLGMVYNYASPSADCYYQYGRDYHDLNVSASLGVPDTTAGVAVAGQTGDKT